MLRGKRQIVFMIIHSLTLSGALTCLTSQPVWAKDEDSTETKILTEAQLNSAFPGDRIKTELDSKTNRAKLTLIYHSDCKDKGLKIESKSDVSTTEFGFVVSASDAFLTCISKAKPSPEKRATEEAGFDLGFKHGKVGIYFPDGFDYKLGHLFSDGEYYSDAYINGLIDGICAEAKNCIKTANTEEDLEAIRTQITDLDLNSNPKFVALLKSIDSKEGNLLEKQQSALLNMDVSNMTQAQLDDYSKQLDAITAPKFKSKVTKKRAEIAYKSKELGYVNYCRAAGSVMCNTNSKYILDDLLASTPGYDKKCGAPIDPNANQNVNWGQVGQRVMHLTGCEESDRAYRAVVAQFKKDVTAGGPLQPGPQQGSGQAGIPVVPPTNLFGGQNGQQSGQQAPQTVYNWGPGNSGSGMTGGQTINPGQGANTAPSGLGGIGQSGMPPGSPLPGANVGARPQG